MPQINQQQRYIILSHLNKVDSKNKIEITLYINKRNISRTIKQKCDQKSGEYKPELAKKI